MKLRLLFAALFLLGSTMSLRAQDFDFGIKFGPTMAWIGTNKLDDKYIQDGKFFGGAAYNGLSNGVSNAGDPSLENRSRSTFRANLGFYSSLRFGNFAVQVEALIAGMGGTDEREITQTTFSGNSYNALIQGYDYSAVEPTYLTNNGLPTTMGTANLGLGEKVRIRYENVYVQIPILARYEFLKVAKPFVMMGPAIGVRALSLQWNDRIKANTSGNAGLGSYDTDVKSMQLGAIGDDPASEQPYKFDMNGVDVSWVFAAGLRLPVVEFELRYTAGLTNFATIQERFGNNEIGGLRNRSLALMIAFNLTGPR